MTLADLFRAERKDPATFVSNDDYMHYSVELYKEFFTFYNSIFGIDEICETNLTLKKGIIFGLLKKLGDISLNYLNLLCNGSLDSICILERSSKEVIVNVLYMLKHYDNDDIFIDYVKFSFLAEKMFYESLLEDDGNLDMQGIMEGIRQRMKDSIVESFADAGFQIDDIDTKYEKDHNHWKKHSIYDRFKDVGVIELYHSYRLDCHATHGNWLNIRRYFIDRTSNCNIQVRTEKIRAVPQLVLPYIMLHGIMLSKIIDKFVDDGETKEKLMKYMDACVSEIRMLDQAHETFLQSHGNYSR